MNSRLSFRNVFSVLLSFLFAFSSVCPSLAQEREKPARILFLVDASGSMTHDWKDGESRFQAGARIINRLIDSIYAVNTDVAFGVRVFGAKYPASEENCFDSEMEVSFAFQNNAQIRARLNHIRPIGFSPIAWSLKEAAEKDFNQSDQYAYSIILITDGGESCGGDICATVEKLVSKKISFTPYILSLVDYAPLKQEYNCLGNYLQVTNEREINEAIKTIVRENRKVLSVRAIQSRPVPKVPPAVAQTPPRPAAPATTPVPTEPRKVEPASPPAKNEEPVVSQEPPKTPEPTPTTSNITRAKVPVLRINSITQPRRFNLLYALDEAKKVKSPFSKAVVFIVEEEKPTASTVSVSKPSTAPPATRPKPKPATPPAAEETKPPVIKTEDAEKTQLQIYFTNGKGKFYTTEIGVNMVNKRTNASKTVFRKMAGSEPAPLEVEAGTYDILIPGSKVNVLNIDILPHKINKVYIEAGRASIGFIHPTAPDKPVEGYTALVSQRFVRGSAVVKQATSEELPYDPENYHIEINTLPPLVYNVYVNFNEKKLISIPETGTVQITNSEKLGKVQFWYLLGERFEPFLNMEINGKLDEQRANFLPGKYQVRYYKLPLTPNQKAEAVPFSIMSGQTTSIFLAP